MSRKRLFIIDGFAQIFRSFYAIKNLENNAVFGFCMFLKKLIDTEQPEYLVVALDSEGPSFRKEMYPPYKANRQAPPESLVRQIPLIKRAIEAFGVPIIEKPGFEADDIMGTLAREGVEKGFQVVLVTGDKDLLQLVQKDDVLYHDPGRNVSFMTEDQVPDFFGCRADQIVDLLTIWGDSSDNIPGIPGVGEKGAKTLLSTYDNLDGIYENLENIKRKAYREGFEKAREDLPLLRKLVKIVRDIDLNVHFESFQFDSAPPPQLHAFFLEMEFRSLAEASRAPLSSLKTSYPCITDKNSLSSWIEDIRKAGKVFFDLETSSLNVLDAEIAGISFALGKGKACYIALRHSNLEPPWAEQAEALLKPLFSDKGITKCAHNLKYDLSVLTARGWDVCGPFDDTMLMSYLLEPRENRHGLDFLAEKHFNYKTISYESLCGSGKDQITFNQLNAEDAANYGAEDSDIGWQLWEKFEPLIKAENLLRVYNEVERDLIEVLVDMELEGVPLDTAYLETLQDQLSEQIEDLKTAIYEEAEETFNINSTKQLGEILFEKHKLPVLGKTTKTKRYSTKQDVLEKLAGMGYELPALILQYRTLDKLLGTYVSKLPAMVHPRSGRIHSNFNQILTETGRLSSDNPNLQNIPIRSTWGAKIREAFVAPEGWTLVAADYSQIELRLLAHFSGDPTLISGFKQGEDIHRRTASEVFDTPLDEVSNEQRQMAKSINFGLIYGMSAFRLSQDLGIPRKVAQNYMDTYFAKMPKVPEFTKRIIEETKEKGEVRTYFGRRRDIPEINSQNKSLEARGERLAINTLIQGSAAEIIKKAMIQLRTRLVEESLEAKLILQVHDELVLLCPESEKELVSKCLVETMEHVVQFEVPLSVEVGIGKNWKETKA